MESPRRLIILHAPKSTAVLTARGPLNAAAEMGRHAFKAGRAPGRARIPAL